MYQKYNVTPEEYAFMNRCYAEYQYYWLLKHGYALNDVLLNFGEALKKQAQHGRPPHVPNIDWMIDVWQNSKPFDNAGYNSFDEFVKIQYANPRDMKDFLTTAEYQQYLYYHNKKGEKA